MRYPATKIEQKWRELWEKRKRHNTDINGVKKPKFYSLVMFPYPSGDKLHIGHWYNFAPADSYARYMRMKGFNVFEPIGFDAFGLPAENYAIKTGVHPTESISKNIVSMVKQLKRMGCMYDWDKTVNTSDPDYYKWTQWVFLKMYKNGLAFRKKAPVNWCPSCKTVLANEQAQDGKCDRCDSEIIQKDLTQWFWKMSAYAQKLLDGHEELEGKWPKNTILMQKNWIGRKSGMDITYAVDQSDEKIVCFTTRPDTNFGATFIVLAPEHPLIRKIAEKKPEIAKYVEVSLNKTERERQAEGRKKTGVFTGLYAINNLTEKKMPVFVSDFVLGSFGTGAVVGVPGHDKRDFEFAKVFEISVVRVVKRPDGDTSAITREEQVQEEEGVMINSDFLNGLDTREAKKKIMDFLEKKGWGKRVILYRLKDWLISRQRYWGAPIPIVYCDKCGEVPVSENDLPVLLPDNVDFKPVGDGKSPLASSEKFVNAKCPKCGGGAKRETDTMDTFVCSSFYYLRYLDGKNQKELVDKKIVKQWMPVSMYIGGPEHACMHLIYARFVMMALKDFGFVPYSEPFAKLVHQGLITYNGAKMSKSKGNVVSPDPFVEKYGSDVFRMYLMFMGPFTEGGDWNDRGITGIARFVDRFYALVTGPDGNDDEETLKLLHKTIDRVTKDIEIFHFNTALSLMMEFVNATLPKGISKDTKKIITSLIAPMAPHLAEECFEYLGETESVFDAVWPESDSQMIKEDSFEMAVQVNGKFRAIISCKSSFGKEKIISLARDDERVRKFLEGNKEKKTIFVPGKLVNFVL